MDAFPASPSSTVLPVYLPNKADAMEHVVRPGMKETFMDIFKRTIPEAREENRFDPDAVQREKISQVFLRKSDRTTLKNADKRLGFIYNNMFIVKCFFTFGLRKVERGMIHLIQTTNVPVLI
ncbi:hypothetical protein NPIL_136151 [Nephila pilipes]|uniref:Uncharacterized protein n=1 Tax=Nephila pilipes TaxID=299642 RepID=A0A8X6R0J3_NEPPI|nr:hypothetical protein NPIL_136151 [Nephila pilipes]